MSSTVQILRVLVATLLLCVVPIHADSKNSAFFSIRVESIELDDAEVILNGVIDFTREINMTWMASSFDKFFSTSLQKTDGSL